MRPFDYSTRFRPVRSTDRRRTGALRPFDIALILLVGGLGLFVAFEVMTRQSHIPRAHLEFARPVLGARRRGARARGGQDGSGKQAGDEAARRHQLATE